MKKIYFIVLVLFACTKVDFPWDLTNLEEAILNNEKMIMIDFYATW